VREHWDKDLRILAQEALVTALSDAGVERPDGVWIGNMMSGHLSNQENLGALVVDHAGLRGVEAFKVEAACASGAAAFRNAYLAVAGGLMDIVVACGVEKMTDTMGGETTAALASAADAVYEGEHGLSFVGLNALLMQRYMFEHGYRRRDFAGFALTAHRNAVTNPRAMFQREISLDAFEQAKPIADPVGLLDSAGIADGAAAAVLMPTSMARSEGLPYVRVRASASATDAVAVHDRRDPLVLDAGVLSSRRAYAQAGIAPTDLDFFELHDAFTIMSALSLEAAGFAARGRGVQLALDGEIGLDGLVPIATMGGLKARGHPVGATGVYQIVETVLQLRGEAGPNQIRNCRLGMAQNIGGSGANIVTHIFERAN
jgi:acetyl-CoA C-acetyltransferase